MILRARVVAFPFHVAVLVAIFVVSACRSDRGPSTIARSDAGAPASPPVPPQAASATSSSSPEPAASLAPPLAPAPSSVETDWCIEGLTALDTETCYVLPPLAAGKPRRLLVYLHGIVPPQARSAQKETVEIAVKNAATRAGAAALVPRGLRGVGPTEQHDWWAWPTDPSTHEKLAAKILARVAAAKKRLEAIAGAPFERTYLAGSSNGAYFLTALAVRGDAEPNGLPIDGYAAISGGAGGRAAPPSPRPFYIGYGAYDPETKATVRSLVASLEAAKWPTRVSVHPFAHGAREIYLDEAFAFWDEAR